MSSKEYFKGKRSNISSRKHDIRTAKPSSYLILTEGAQTEPRYLGGIASYINDTFGKNIEVRVPKITIQGKGKSSLRLVEEAIALRAKSHHIYQYCWVVFDKDDNKDFDEAIDLAKRNNIQVAWSNQSFEYWLCLHFALDKTPRTRGEWEKKIDSYFKRSGFSPKGYHKNAEELKTLAISGNYLKLAVENASRAELEFSPNVPASKKDPCTTVHYLIKELAPYLKEML